MTRYFYTLKRKKTRTIAIVAALATALTTSIVLTTGASADPFKDPAKGYDSSTVKGDTNSRWFGPYQIRHQGQVIDGFCIDHGNPNAPEPTSLVDWDAVNINDVSAEKRTAIAWAVGTYLNSASGEQLKINNAATKLVEQEFMGAVYGGSPLNVDTLQPGNMVGFNGQGAAVIAKAKEIKAFAWAHRNLVSSSSTTNPYTIKVSLNPEKPGPNEAVIATARVHDQNNAPVTNVTIGATVEGGTLISATHQTTNANGVATWQLKNAGGDHTLKVGVTNFGGSRFPISNPLVYKAQNMPSQRVVTAKWGISTGTATAATEGKRQIIVKKHGDNRAYTSVKGAIFTAYDANGKAVGSMTSNEQGDTQPLTVDPGVYTVKETKAPDGYQLDPQPQKVDVTAKQDGPKQLVFEDLVKRGKLQLEKRDSATNKLMGGVHFKLEYDSDNDGSFDKVREADIVTVADKVTTVNDLKPGNYKLTETVVPAGYSGAGPKTFNVKPGETVTVVMLNSPNKEKVRGVKTDDTGTKPLAGAVIDLYRKGPVENPPTPPADAKKFDGYTWLDRDTSNEKGELDFGDRSVGFTFCYHEAKAPAGYVATTTELQCAPGVLQFGKPIKFEIKNKPEGRIIGKKFDSATKAPLQGAVFDLYRQLAKGEKVTASADQPDDAPTFDGFAWVARGTSGEDGNIDFGTFPPGGKYCAFETTVPTGYTPDTQMRCMSAAMTTDTVVLELPNVALAIVLSEQQTPPQPVVESETLAKTGGQWIRLTFFGLGLVLLGRMLMIASRRRKPRWMV